jgi:hypothetical protein
LAKNRADDHLAKMGILSLAHRIDTATLADQASHGGIFVPDVTQLNLGNLSKCVVEQRVLRISKDCKLANQLTSHGGA